MNIIFQPSLDIDYLYQIADKDNDGYIGTTDALEFFQYTQLNRQFLSQIWTFCVPSKQPMNKESFILSLRCIYYVQKGIQLTKELLQNQQQPFNAPLIDCPFLISSDQFSQLEISFKRITEMKSLTISKIQLIHEIEYFQKNEQLKIENIQIDTLMKLCDIDEDNELNYIEYILSISCIKYYHIFQQLPSSIPSIFISSIKKRMIQPTPIKRSKTRQIPLIQHSKVHHASKSQLFQPLQSPSSSQSSQQSSQRPTSPLSPRSQRAALIPIVTIDSPPSKSSSKSSSISSTPRLSNQLSIGNQSNNSPTVFNTIRSSTISNIPISINSPQQLNEKIQQKKETKRIQRSTSVCELKTMKTPRRSSISDNKISEQSKSISRHSFSSKTISSFELSTMKKIEYSKSLSQSSSPLLDKNIFITYLKNRRELINNIDNDMEFDSFSFSDDSELSLEDIPMYNITGNWKINKELDDMILYLSMKKAELLSEIEQLEIQLEKK